VTYAVVARAPIEEIEVVRKRMGWKFPWVSSYRSDFNYDFDVSFTSDQVASGRAIYNFGPAPEWAAGIEIFPAKACPPHESPSRIPLKKIIG
jgi:predicted dithiol-disulfide oxidoreductase (DUF899 family)